MDNYQNTVNDLQKNMLNLLCGITILLSWLAIVITQKAITVWLLVALIALCCFVYVFAQRGFSLVRYLFVFGLWGLNLAAVHYHIHPSAYLFLSGIVLIASSLIGTPIALIIACGSSIVILVNAQDLVSLVFVWFNLILSYIFSRGLQYALQAMLNYQSYAVSQMQEAREHRAELVKTTKALSDAQENLYHANSQLKAARDIAEESRRLKVQFAANVSHELRTPINLIVGFSEVIALAPEAYKIPLPSVYRPDILAIYRNARHLQNLINDILDISQVEAEHMAVIKEETDPRQIILEAANMARDMIEHKNLVFQLAIPDAIPSIWLDRTRIRQVILNLLANAVRFTDQGIIHLSAQLTNENLIISVTDTGIGIPLDQIDRVFEEFYQVEGTHSRKQGGTGLGLTLSRKFVEQHDGHMWVESEGIVGKGATFSFSIRRESSTDQQVMLQNNTKRPSEAKSVVVWDDDQAILHLFKGYSQKYPIYGSTNPVECMQLIHNVHPTAVILSQNAYSSSLADSIQQAEPGVTLIVCPMPSGRRTMQNFGVADYLVKPISRQGLLHALDSLNRGIKNILIIDDERDLVRMFVRMLETASQPYKIRTAFGGLEGLTLMREQSPDVVILDILMPDIDGFTVIHHMKSDPLLKDIPIVVASARGASEAISSEAHGTISITRSAGFKPVELINCLEAFVGALIPTIGLRP